MCLLSTVACEIFLKMKIECHTPILLNHVWFPTASESNSFAYNTSLFFCQLPTICSPYSTKSQQLGSALDPPQKVFSVLEMHFLLAWSFKDIVKSDASSGNDTWHHFPAPLHHHIQAHRVRIYMLFSLHSFIYHPEHEFILALYDNVCVWCVSVKNWGKSLVIKNILKLLKNQHWTFLA